MPESQSPRFSITFRFADDSQGGTSEEKAASFWANVRLRSRDSDVSLYPSDDATLLRRVKQRFGLRLRELLLAGGSGHVNELRGGFTFTVTEAKFGSLELTLGTFGLKSLAEFCDNNLELFQIITEQYAPDALATSLTGQVIDWGDGFDCKMKGEAELVKAFDAETPSAETSKDRSPSEKMAILQWAWIRANTSLLLPVLAGLLVLYFAHDGIVGERERLSTAVTSLNEEHAEVLKILTSVILKQQADDEATTDKKKLDKEEPPKKKKKGVKEFGE